MSQSAGDVGEWLGVDSGGPAPVQVTLVLGMPFPGASCFVLPFFLSGPQYVECLQIICRQLSIERSWPHVSHRCDICRA